jgi:hypothetical protein
MVHDEKSDALERLARELPGGNYSTALITGTGRIPRLMVASRTIPGHDAEVFVDSGWYWWAWGERIAEVSDPDTAAAKVAQAMGAPETSGEQVTT